MLSITIIGVYLIKHNYKVVNWKKLLKCSILGIELSYIKIYNKVK